MNRTQIEEVGSRNAEVEKMEIWTQIFECGSGEKRNMGHRFSQMNTDKNIFYALRAGLIMQQRVKVKTYHVTERSPETLSSMTNHRNSIYH